MKHLIAHFRATALGLALSAAALTGHAATVQFNLNSATAGSVASYGETAGGHTLTATGWVSVGGAGFTAAQVRQNSSTLGVNSRQSDGNPGQIDNASNQTEALLFDFGSSDFSSVTLAFTLLNSSDVVNLWFGDSLNMANATAPLANFVANPGTNPFTLSNFGGARYLLVAASENGDTTSSCSSRNSSGNACFRMDGLTAEVPEPSALALVGVALAAGLWAPRRRKPKAA